jgi:branched-subunit amino acid aminotransferase/4-amino-4-deoxychorismate lyase
MTQPQAPVRLHWSAHDDGFELGHSGGEHVAGPDQGPYVVDSWLLEDGHVRALDLHAARFAGSCVRTAGADAEQVTRFAEATVARLPGTGAWFPRLECTKTPEGPRFALWIRPAPPLGKNVRLWSPGEGEDPPASDMRIWPDVKGPDLAVLGRLRARAVELGAHDALLLDADGCVLETATAGLLWWRDGALCAPPEDGRVLPSVTRALITEIARAQSIPVRTETVRPEQLEGLEVWAVNALHGIRPVLDWPAAPFMPGPAPRAAAWIRQLERRAARLPAGPSPILTATRASREAL